MNTNTTSWFSILWFAGFVLLSKQLGFCRADDEYDGVECDCVNKDSNGLMLELAQRTKETEAGRRYDLGGLFYNEKGKLTISLAAPAENLPTRRDLERVDGTPFHEILLDVYGPTVLLSQLNEKHAEKILQKAEKKAHKQAKKSRDPPPVSTLMAAELKRTLLRNKKVQRKVNIEFVPAKYSFRDLYGDYQKLLTTLSGYNFVSLLDLDEANNSIYVSVNKGSLERVKLVVERLGIDAGKIVLEERSKPDLIFDGIEEDEGTLQGRIRPIAGGLYIEVPTEESLNDNDPRGCSIGFVAKRAQTNEVGFVTASHCTKNMYELDSPPMKAYQFWRSVVVEANDACLAFQEPSNHVATETHDAPFNAFGGQCSDSAFFTIEENVNYYTGIYKTFGPDSPPQIKTSDPITWSSVFIDGNSLANEVVFKVGRRTGSRTGRVVRTCAFVTGGNLGDSRPYFCQDIVNNNIEGVLFAFKGDSGSAAFYTTSASSKYAWIRGISFGREPNPDNCPLYPVCQIPPSQLPPGAIDDPLTYPPEFWDHLVSPIGNVECDHGPLVTYFSDLFPGFELVSP